MRACTENETARRNRRTQLRIRSYMTWSSDVSSSLAQVNRRNRVRRLLVRVGLALRLQRRLTSAEASQLFQLALTILEQGRMMQSRYEYRVPNVVVEVEMLSHLLRETPDTIGEALGLLREMGRAERFDRQGRWTLDLADDTNPLSRGSSAGG